MPNARYVKGATFERFIVNKLRAAGWEAHRFAGSKGAWDVHAWRRPMLIPQPVAVSSGQMLENLRAFGEEVSRPGLTDERALALINRELEHISTERQMSPDSRYIQASAGPAKDKQTRAALAVAPLPAGAVGEIWRKREGGAVEVIRWDGDVWASVEEWWL